MMNRVIVVFIITLAISTSVFGQTLNPDYFDGEYFIKVKSLKGVTSTSSVTNVNIAAELPFLSVLNSTYSIQKVTRPFTTLKSNQGLSRVYRVKIANLQNEKTFFSSLKRNSEVEYIERIPLRKVIFTPNDTAYSNQWALAKIQANLAWDISTGSSVINVAVVDNGVQTNHPDLAGNIIAGYDVADGDSNPNPNIAGQSHGTHVAGIVGAVTNNNKGVASLGFNKIKIIPVKTAPDGETNYITHGYEGIVWAINNGAKVINTSWGGGAYSSTEQDIFNTAFIMGIVCVASAGNETSSAFSYPAAYDHVISVASTTTTDALSYFSNYGAWVDIAAPGSGILSTIPFNSYASFSGTSMASPLVASFCGYILSINPTWTPTQVETYIKTYSDDIDAQNSTKLPNEVPPRINAYKAVSCASSSLTAAISPTTSQQLCLTDSVLLTANVSAGASYVWKKDGIVFASNTPSVYAKAAGSIVVVATQNACSVVSNAVVFSLKKTTDLLSKDTSVVVCNTTRTPSDSLSPVLPTCYSAQIFNQSYTGDVVGYDGGNISDADPSVNFALAATAKVNKVKVVVTFKKKSGGDETSCAGLDGGQNPYNNEIVLRVKSPDGTIVNLVNSSGYVAPTQGGTVTVTFEDGAAALSPFPTTGTFAPTQPLSTFQNKLVNGTWTLLPDDNAYGDPLCVSGFSIIMDADIPNSTLPTVKWYADSTSMTPIYIGSKFLPTNNSLGSYKYFATATCPTVCESYKVASIFQVTNSISGPTLAVVPFNFINTYSLSQSTSLTATTDKNGYQVHDNNSNTVNATIIINGRPAMTNPITICPPQGVLIVVFGCTNSTINWSNKSTGNAIIAYPTQTTTYSVTCTPFNGGCTSLPQTVTLNVGLPLANITESIPTNSSQNFYATKIEALNVINTPVNIKYIANDSVVLLPGFNSGTTFEAKIGNCN